MASVIELKLWNVQNHFTGFFSFWNHGLKSLPQLSSKKILAIYITIAWIEILYFSPRHCLLSIDFIGQSYNMILGYRAHSFPSLSIINAQVVEQNNSKLMKLKSSLSYMKPENFMNILMFFLWFWNQEIKRKISK